MNALDSRAYQPINQCDNRTGKSVKFTSQPKLIVVAAATMILSSVMSLARSNVCSSLSGSVLHGVVESRYVSVYSTQQSGRPKTTKLGLRQGRLNNASFSESFLFFLGLSCEKKIFGGGWGGSNLSTSPLDSMFDQ